MKWQRRVSSPVVGVLAIVCSGCSLLPLFEPNPTGCEPGSDRTERCGPCEEGLQFFNCGEDRRWNTTGECLDNEYDRDDDGYATEECFDSVSASAVGCCGEVPDCDDEHPERWPGHADVDEDGYLDDRCGGDDCDDDNSDVWYLHADLDDDGHHDTRCGGDDCDDSDPRKWLGHADNDGDGHEDVDCDGDDCNDDDVLRWSGHADLDGDGHDDEACGGDDCDDDDPLRWPGHADIDGDGHNAHSCGGDDCDDDDPLRWSGHADLDGDGNATVACGGTDCDDDCDTCGPTRASSCGGGRDHDCDGFIDELTGCHAPAPTGFCEPTGPLATGDSREVFVVDERAYVASFEGLFEVDLSLNPMVVDFVDIGESWDVVVARGHAYVTGPLGLSIVDVEGSSRMARVAGPVDTGDSRGVFIYNNLALVASFSGFHVVDVTSPESPYVVTSLRSPDVLDSRDIWMVWDYAVIVRDNHRGDNGIYLVDISNVYNAPLTVAEGDVIDSAKGIAMFENRAFISSGDTVLPATVTLEPAIVQGEDVTAPEPQGLFAWVNVLGSGSLIVAGSHQVLVYEVDRTATMPILIDSLEIAGNARGVVVSGDLAYVATDRGLLILELTCPP